MTDVQQQQHRSLIEEIDGRQDDVLGQLDQLNARIETLLKEIMATRGSDDPLMEEDEVASAEAA